MIPCRSTSAVQSKLSLLLTALSLFHDIESRAVATASSASETSAVTTWKIPHLEFFHRSDRSFDNHHDFGALCESDFLDDDDDDDGREQHQEEEYRRSGDLFHARSFPRGGGRAAATASRRINRASSHRSRASRLSFPGWQRYRPARRRGHSAKRKGYRIIKSNGSTKSTIQANVQQIQNEWQTERSQKLRQFRKSFRRKQRARQDAIYRLNSRIYQRASTSSSSEDPMPFPPPPYRQWQMAPEPQIGKTSLTGKIFLANIAVFALQAAFPSLTSWGAKRSDLILQGRQLHRLITPVFLHGGIGHLMANSYSLKSTGLNVERAFGPTRFLATYLVSGMAGNVLSAIRSPNPAVGASGAIFGLVGAYYTFLARNAELFGSAGRMQKSVLMETIGINLLLGMTNPMVDNWGHIGGFLGGVGMAWLIGPKLYVARVPLMEPEDWRVSGSVAPLAVVDRPTIAMRTPEFLEEGFYWMDENMRRLGKTVTAPFERLLGSIPSGGIKNQEFLFVGNGRDDEINIVKNNKTGGIPLEGNIYINPTDGFRQDVSELDPGVIRQRQRQRIQSRRSAPRPGRSIRPRYGHLYR